MTLEDLVRETKGFYFTSTLRSVNDKALAETLAVLFRIKKEKMNFPFGQKIKKVEQKDRSPKEYFILGVYASAVHARWLAPDGKQKVKALAVASESEIFWNGDKVQGEKLISNISVPPEIGRLEFAAANLNGPSGRELDKNFLSPLSVCRSEVWLCDLLPYARLNDSQYKAIKREYEPLEQKFDLPEVTIAKVPSRFSDEERINEIIDEIEESNTEKIILLGDIPIKEFYRKFNNQYKKLSDFEEYGKWHKLKIRNRDYYVLPLVHPRQSGQLGRSSKKWYETHQEWINKQ
jgi:hypothetical protein